MFSRRLAGTVPRQRNFKFSKSSSVRSWPIERSKERNAGFPESMKIFNTGKNEGVTIGKLSQNTFRGQLCHHSIFALDWISYIGPPGSDWF